MNMCNVDNTDMSDVNSKLLSSLRSAFPEWAWRTYGDRFIHDFLNKTGLGTKSYSRGETVSILNEEKAALEAKASAMQSVLDLFESEADLLDLSEKDPSQEEKMYFFLERNNAGAVAIKQFETLGALIESELQGKNPDCIRKCDSADAFMTQYTTDGREILVIEGVILPIKSDQRIVVTWSIGSDEEKTNN